MPLKMKVDSDNLLIMKEKSIHHTSSGSYVGLNIPRFLFKEVVSFKCIAVQYWALL